MHFFTKFRLPDFVVRKLLNGNLDGVSLACSGPVFRLLFICCVAPVFVMAATNPYENRTTYTPAINSASFVLHGTVVDEKDQTLPGATVVLKGSKNGATTDINGKFILEIPTEQDSIIVSFVGYKSRTVFVGSNRTMTIKLEPDADNQKLNEVQIVGFGTQKKTTMVGAVSSVSVKEVQKYSTPSLTNAIAGRLSGVITRQTSGEPGYDAAKIFIRGLVSQSGSNAPLIIVDGAERELNSYWTNMNIQEIESFSVLKDATSTAVYGSRGANGVVLITTKKGAVGRPKVTFRTEAAIVTPFRLEDNIDGYEYASLINENRLNMKAMAGIDPNLPSVQPVYTAEQLEKFKDGSDPYAYPNINWYDEVFRKRTKQLTNNLGVSGGSEAVRYYINLGYSLLEGIYKEDPNSKYETNTAIKQYNFRSNIDMNLTKKFTVALGLSGIIKGANFPGPDKNSIFTQLKLYSPITSAKTLPDGSAPAGPNIDQRINPYSLVTKTGYTKQYYTTLISNLSAKWDLASVTQGLSVSGLLTYDVVDITQNVRREFPATFRYNPFTKVYTPVQLPSPLGLSLQNENYKTAYGQFSIDYSRSFGKHNVSGTILGSRREYTNVNTGSSIDNLPQRRQHAVGRLTYNFDSRYSLEANAGYTGSENFLKGRRYGLFPSIGAAWIVSNERFWNKNVVSTLKLRGSYGVVGNDQIGQRFLFQSTFNLGAAGYSFGFPQVITENGRSENFIGNPNVTWETAYKTDLGTDLELLNGKITLTADLFHERRKGQLLRRQVVPAYVGYPSSIIPYANVGETENKGIDGSFQFRNTTKGGFYYSVNGTFTFAKNKITENDQPPPQYPWQDFRGQPIGANLGYEAIGFFKDLADISSSPVQTFGPVGPGDTKYRDVNGDNKIDVSDRVFIGKYGSEPQMVFGLGGTVAYKGFDMTVFFMGNGRRDFFFTQGFTAFPFRSNEGEYNVMQMVYDQRWIPGADNTNAKFPAVRALSQNNSQSSTVFFRNGEYLRLRNAELGYTLPASVARKISMSSVRIFAQGTNLATWDRIKAIDPESDFGTGTYPVSRNFNFGLEVNF
jgi:TonB-linked SusC/RagA family outer membrane protein